MITRLKGILSLDSAAFREVERDEKATGQAALVVIVSSILAAIGVSIDPFFTSAPSAYHPRLVSLGMDSTLVVFLGIATWSILAWLLWSAVAYIIGTKLYRGEATFGEMLRVTGFAFAPLAFIILGGIPIIGLFITFLAIAWVLAAVFLGLRASLNLTVNQTVVTEFIGGFVFVTGMGFLHSIFGLL